MRIIPKASDELNVLSGYLRSEAAERPVLRVLEAGCGREWHLQSEGIALEIFGIDTDSHALEFRRDVRRDLDHAIVGDLRTAQLPVAQFDVVYSSYVLEHVDGAERALDNMVAALKPGGLLMLRVPDLDGVQTFVARRLPHWCAVLYHRYVWGIKNAGKPGFAPYPTHYDQVISASGFHEYCGRAGLSIIDQMGVVSYSEIGQGFLSRFVPIIARMISIVSLGSVHDRYVNLTFVARKEVAQ